MLPDLYIDHSSIWYSSYNSDDKGWHIFCLSMLDKNIEMINSITTATIEIIVQGQLEFEQNDQ